MISLMISYVTFHVSFQSLDPNSSYVPDIYDELLTQAEIQGNVNKVNCKFIITVQCKVTIGCLLNWTNVLCSR